MHIFLDESGDLGFNTGGSKYFTIAVAITSKPKHIYRPVKRIKEEYKIPSSTELKSYNTSPNIKFNLLHTAAKQPIDIHYITVEKAKVFSVFHNNSNVFYNYMVGLLLVDVISAAPSNTHVMLKVDKRIENIKIGRQLNEYIKGEIWIKKARPDIELTIIHEESHNCLGLQFADIVSNGIFRKYERKNPDYYDVIKPQIKGRQTLYF